jgi:hypothetical protein
MATTKRDQAAAVLTSIADVRAALDVIQTNADDGAFVQRGVIREDLGRVREVLDRAQDYFSKIKAGEIETETSSITSLP